MHTDYKQQFTVKTVSNQLNLIVQGADLLGGHGRELSHVPPQEEQDEVGTSKRGKAALLCRRDLLRTTLMESGEVWGTQAIPELLSTLVSQRSTLLRFLRLRRTERCPLETMGLKTSSTLKSACQGARCAGGWLSELEQAGLVGGLAGGAVSPWINSHSSVWLAATATLPSCRMKSFPASL